MLPSTPERRMAADYRVRIVCPGREPPSTERARALRFDPSRLTGLGVGVAGPQAPGSETAFEVRAFFTGVQGVARSPA